LLKLNKMLYIVATPIGNLKDITFRAVEVLKNSEIILCEDTRVSKKLLNYYQIKKPLLSYHQHSSPKKVEKIISLLKEGKTISLICDAGTPGIADPAGKLIEEIIKKAPQIEIKPIPGPSALTTALSAAGLPANQFVFLGFLPKRKKRKVILEKILTKEEKTIVFYESPFRIIKTLSEMEKIDKESNLNHQTIVFKELTKKFEKTWRGNSIKEVLEKINKENKIKGEFVIVLKKRNGKEK